MEYLANSATVTTVQHDGWVCYRIVGVEAMDVAAQAKKIFDDLIEMGALNSYPNGLFRAMRIAYNLSNYTSKLEVHANARLLTEADSFGHAAQIEVITI